MYRNKQPHSYSEVLSKMMRFCAYQERSVFEVEQKLRVFGQSSDDNDLIIDYLVNDDFLNNERFAAAYVKGKVSIKKWGFYKIKQGLSQKGIRGAEAEDALKEINEEVYFQNLEELSEKKLRLLEGEDKKSERMYRFLLSKGYEGELIVKMIKKYF